MISVKCVCVDRAHSITFYRNAIEIWHFSFISFRANKCFPYKKSFGHFFLLTNIFWQKGCSHMIQKQMMFSTVKPHINTYTLTSTIRHLYICCVHTILQSLRWRRGPLELKRIIVSLPELARIDLRRTIRLVKLRFCQFFYTIIIFFTRANFVIRKIQSRFLPSVMFSQDNPAGLGWSM